MTITILMGDGSQQQVTDAQTAANLFAQGGEVLTAAGGLYQPTEMAGAGTNPAGWLINGVTLTDYFAPAAVVPPSVATTIVNSTQPAIVPTKTIYRLILPLPDGSFATGANYAGCSQTSSAYCDPQSFQSLQAAVDYATQGQEIPVLVSSDKEAWNIVAGNETPAPSQILPSRVSTPPVITPPVEIPPPVIDGGVPPQAPASLFSSPLALGALGLGAYFLFRKKG